MNALYKKELSYYLNNPIGYIVTILFAIFANFLYMKDIFVIGSASLQPFFGILPWLLLIFVPALTMRIIAEEKRTNTIETLLTIPVSETQIIVAKFLAVGTLLFFALLLTFGLPLSLSFLTKLYLPEIIVGYIGSLGLGLAFTAVSMFFSSQTKNQVVAFLGSIITIFVLLVMGTDFMANVLPKIVLDAIAYLTPLYHFQNFIKGVIDIRSVVYFISFMIVFLFITIVNLEKRA